MKSDTALYLHPAPVLFVTGADYPALVLELSRKLADAGRGYAHYLLQPPLADVALAGKDAQHPELGVAPARGRADPVRGAEKKRDQRAALGGRKRVFPARDIVFQLVHFSSPATVLEK